LKVESQHYGSFGFTPLKVDPALKRLNTISLDRDQFQVKFQGAPSQSSQPSQSLFEKVTQGTVPKLIAGGALLLAGLSIKLFGLATVLAAPILVPLGIGLASAGALLVGWGGIQSYKQSKSSSKVQADDSKGTVVSNQSPAPSKSSLPPALESTGGSAPSIQNVASPSHAHQEVHSKAQSTPNRASSNDPKANQPKKSSPKRSQSRPIPPNASAAHLSHQSQTPLCFQEAYGTQDIKQIRFKQKSGTNSCYLLASLDSLLQHPAGHQALEKIQFFRTGNDYRVIFPGQPRPILITNAELADPMVEGPLGIRLIEKAYLKIPGTTLDYDNPTSAMERIFGWQTSKTESIKLQDDPEARQFIGGVEFPFAERTQQFKSYVEKLPQTRQFGNVDSWCAMEKGIQHWYSLRFDPESPNSIIRVDPFDTQNRVKTLTIDELLNKYHLEGTRISI
jgi:hypothetical protein